MIIIIDGYNILKQERPNEFIGAEVRDRFVDQLRSYAKSKNHVLIVVFDGGDFFWPYEISMGFVKVVYSGNKATADDLIKKLLNEFRGRELLLVSSDHELCVFAQKDNVPSIGSAEFQHFLKQKEIAKRTSVLSERVKKYEEEVSPELDELMNSASSKMLFKDRMEEDASLGERSKKRTLSKEEKKMLKIAKKL